MSQPATVPPVPVPTAPPRPRRRGRFSLLFGLLGFFAGAGATALQVEEIGFILGGGVLGALFLGRFYRGLLILSLLGLLGWGGWQYGEGAGWWEALRQAAATAAEQPQPAAEAERPRRLRVQNPGAAPVLLALDYVDATGDRRQDGWWTLAPESDTLLVTTAGRPLIVGVPAVRYHTEPAPAEPVAGLPQAFPEAPLERAELPIDEEGRFVLALPGGGSR